MVRWLSLAWGLAAFGCQSKPSPRADSVDTASLDSGDSGSEGGAADAGGSSGTGGDSASGDSSGGGSGADGSGSGGSGAGSEGSGGTGDAGAGGDPGTGGGSGSASPYIGSWSGTISIDAVAEGTTGTTTDTCLGTIQIAVAYPAFDGTLTCEWAGGLAALGWDSGLVTGTVQVGDEEVMGFIELGLVPLDFLGTIDSSAISATFSGEGGSGSTAVSMSGSFTVTPD